MAALEPEQASNEVVPVEPSAPASQSTDADNAPTVETPAEGQPTTPDAAETAESFSMEEEGGVEGTQGRHSAQVATPPPTAEEPAKVGTPETGTPETPKPATQEAEGKGTPRTPDPVAAVEEQRKIEVAEKPEPEARSVFKKLAQLSENAMPMTPAAAPAQLVPGKGFVAENRIFTEFQHQPLDATFTYEQLKGLGLEDGIDASRKEDYLSEEEFQKLFGTRREDFKKLAKWRQAMVKKSVGLF